MEEQDDMQGWHHQQELEREFYETQKDENHGATKV
jgi:hypothetical protein